MKRVYYSPRLRLMVVAWYQLEGSTSQMPANTRLRAGLALHILRPWGKWVAQITGWFSTPALVHVEVEQFRKLKRAGARYKRDPGRYKKFARLRIGLGGEKD